MPIDNGASAYELMAMFGWSNLAEAEHYTRAADRRRLSSSGMLKILGARERIRTKVSHVFDSIRVGGTVQLKNTIISMVKNEGGAPYRIKVRTPM